MAKKQKYEELMSPEGIAAYPYLNQGNPAEKYKKPGEHEYKVTIVLDKSIEENVRFLADLDAKYEALVVEEKGKLLDASTNDDETAKDKKKFAKAAKMLESAPVWEDEMDDDDKPTGNALLKLKQRSEFTTKKGEVISMHPTLFDSQGKPMFEPIWAGSRVKACFQLRPYPPIIKDKEALVGYSRDLLAVQVLDLVTRGSRSADGYGFDTKEEGGFVSSGESGGEVLAVNKEASGAEAYADNDEVVDF